MLVYISGKISDTTNELMHANADKAEVVHIKMMEQGINAICPHTMTRDYWNRCKATHGQYMECDLDILARCDAIYMLDNWETSKGAKMELDYAKQLGIPIFYEALGDWPAPSRVETRFPNQARRFKEELGKMYRMMLKKNADYSPANIQATGLIGVGVRVLDKALRACNLLGFDIKAELVGFEGAREASNEPFMDAFRDMSVYGIIALLLNEGNWGK